MRSAHMLLAFLILTACNPPASTSPSKRGINLGPQQAIITLAAGENHNVNIAPTGNTTTFIRFSTNASGSTLTGLDASTVTVGDMFFLRRDAGTGFLTINHEDTDSTATNRFRTPGGVPFSLSLWGAAMVEYDGTVNRWVVNPLPATDPTFQGNVSANGTQIPVLSTCGTSPAIVAGSTGFSGSYTTGSAATTCTLTFAAPFAVAPSCLIVAPGAAVVVPTYTTSTTAITVSVDIASTTYHYVCVGH